MKKGKKFLLIIIILFLLWGTTRYIRSPELKIRHFVEKNHLELTRIAKAHLKSEPDTKVYQGVEVEGVFRGSYDMVQFYYGGFGIAPASKYYGFYYSPADVPLPYQNGPIELFKTKKGWGWAEKGRDNGGKTIRIMKCWFYYEAWF